METALKIFITRDCLNAGITEIECSDLCVLPTGAIWPKEYFYPGDWHRTRPEAVAKAESMRLDEIDRLEKRLAQLQAMRFK